MQVLLGTLWLTLACSSVHATLSKSDAKKAASKMLQEKVGGLGTRQRADHHASFPTGGWEPTASRELHLWADSTVAAGKLRPSLDLSPYLHERRWCRP